jgi:hypothetical protein
VQQSATKLEIASMKCGLQAGDELAAKDTAEHVDGKEEAAGRTDPSAMVRSQSPAARMQCIGGWKSNR